MKYVITGSLGHISKPIVQSLVAAGHEVTVISSQAQKANEIHALNANAAIGSLDDSDFLSDVFRDADAVYLMIPPNFATDDWMAYQRYVADNFVAAIAASQRIRYVVQLSSIGAHMRTGAGPIDGLAYLEEQLAQFEDLNILFLRPSYFYYNLYNLIPLLLGQGIAGSNFGSDTEKLVLVHHEDIAAEAAARLLQLDFTGHSITYISSDERFTADIARTLAKAVGKENAPWIVFSDEEAHKAMLAQGLHPTHANGYVALGRAIREGKLQEDYREKHKGPQGSYKLEDFAMAFSSAVNTNS